MNKKLKEILKDYQIPNFEEKIDIIKLWYKAYADGILKQKTESQCEQAFNQDFFGKILGYTTFPNEVYTIDPKANTEISGQKPDAILGYFSKDKNKIVAVVEIKDVNKPLDKSQQREGNLTPVQQAFKYKPQYKNCEFVIATNFYETRLLKDNQLDYESFTLDSLLDEKDNYFQFKKFYYLLNSENFISNGNKTKIEELVLEIRIEQELITKNFYNLYKDLRLNLMRDIWSNNKDKQNIDFTIKKAQKIVDRVVFICFCEDKNLLPDNTLERVLKQSENNLMSLWDSLKGLFNLIDIGSSKLEIPEGYNGGLFAEDLDLDSLKINDKALIELLKLGHYDFEYDLSVNILGHIFEQSISDLEEIKNKVEKIEEDKKESKRKKDGIFYTPDYIVDYIVKNSLGRYLEEKENILKEKHNLKEEIQDKTYKEREKKVYEEYQVFLQNIKVLDPACGSGAFLVRVFDYLLEENKRVGKILGDSLFNSEVYFRTILKNNIFGVDLNEESIEITKLSLWLKTAQKGKKLTTLDNNIKCGNSLIEDKKIAGEKAFNWKEEFKEIMNNGGFDVIIGNPPYVPAESISQNQKDFFINNYKSAFGRINIYAIFYEKAINIIKDKGVISFINPYTILKNQYFIEIRRLILENTSILQIVDFKNTKIFEDAAVDSIIMILKKSLENNNIVLIDEIKDFIGQDYRISKYKKEDLIEHKDLAFILNGSSEFINKLYINSKKVSEVVDFNQGIITGDNKKFIFNYNKNVNCKPVISGGDFNRYTEPNSTSFVEYSNNLHRPRKRDIFEIDQKILLRQTGSYPICTIDYRKYYTLDTVHNGIIIDENFDIKYLLCLLNSKLIKYIYNQQINEDGKIFAQVKIIYVNELPIKILDKNNQIQFANKADIVLFKNKELQNNSNKFIELLRSNFNIEKINTKLENWYNLDFSDFKKELKKNKIELKGENEENWLERFNRLKQEIIEILNIVNQTDKEIDQMVYKLYNLSEDEIKIVENNI